MNNAEEIPAAAAARREGHESTKSLAIKSKKEREREREREREGLQLVYRVGSCCQQKTKKKFLLET